MDKFIIQGGTPLHGTVSISGAKNSVLPLMISTILTDEDIVLDNVPYLSDVVTLHDLLVHLGITIEAKSDSLIEDLRTTLKDSFTITLNSSTIHSLTAPYDIVRKMRASFWVLGPLLSKHGEAKVSLPGGCAIGARQIDQHLATLEAMGASIFLEDGYIHAQVQGKLKGTCFHFSKVSVGATINAITAAVLAEGESLFINCAYEPEIVDLCHLLLKMGAIIEGIGTSRLHIVGQNFLKGARHTIIPDRIEAGTFIAAVGLTGGEINLTGINYPLIENLCEKFKESGYDISQKEGFLNIKVQGPVFPVNIDTGPFPGFPTDMQAQFMALMCMAQGVSTITENIHENRYMHVPELNRMGADITLNNKVAIINGHTSFKGANVTASDLRASVCLILAGMAAQGETIVHRIYHTDRGYSRLEKKLVKCGANIIRTQ